jgi:arginine/ornithine N-succinyltransferase beta subunit
MKDTINIKNPNQVKLVDQPKKVSELLLEAINNIFREEDLPRNETTELKYRNFIDIYGAVIGLENDINRHKGVRRSVASDIALMELDKKYADCLNVIGKELMGNIENYEAVKEKVAVANGYKKQVV